MVFGDYVLNNAKRLGGHNGSHRKTERFTLSRASLIRNASLTGPTFMSKPVSKFE